jgi:hypothetical protein
MIAEPVSLHPPRRPASAGKHYSHNSGPWNPVAAFFVSFFLGQLTTSTVVYIPRPTAMAIISTKGGSSIEHQEHQRKQQCDTCPGYGSGRCPQDSKMQPVGGV